MKELKWIIVKSAIYACVIGAMGAVLLYVPSTWFFNAKNKQTLIQSISLEKTSDNKIFPIGVKLPTFSFTDLSSKKVYFLEKDLKPIKIINFWASWCKPCVEEFSSFARLIKQLNGEVSFVGINEDNTVDTAKEFLKAFNTDFKNLTGTYFGFDKDKIISSKYGVLSLPETFLVDPHGKLIQRISGFENWDTPEAIKYFKSLLKKYKGK